ncbi:stage V sporulation protein E [Thermoanaerobacter kivui]|uniref:Peptidoglycan glycosyltransferase RodA n=1 Tax=Thermoanaerobacter kivui TaxID=2325 RepID=A0A097AQL0_THEKI|nr:rod shape-determining protein RodA [Thermoanaerobacter kivui]AIS52095.1 stage V sporulation protein E [Thermoanaerobacter kivui]
MFNKKLLKNFDWGLLITVILISVYSVIVIASASHAIETGSYKKVIVQTVAILIGLLSIVAICLIDYNVLAKFSSLIYILNVISLLLVLAIGKVSNGAQSWIHLGPVDIQPSEFSKIALILTLANMFSNTEEIKTFKELLWPMVYVGIPFVVVMLQPDLGTTLVFVAIFLTMVYISGIRTKVLAQLIGLGIAMLPLGYEILKPYQRNRLLSFLNPEMDPMGTGYHVIQSKIAIGSGMFWGKGLFHGSQTQLYYLPEAWTDFIFSVVGEELGFIGASILIVLYAIMLYKAWKIAYNAKDKYGMLVAVGIIAMFTFHIFENIGMTIGIMPITGIPLPFMSYGGSAMVADMMAIGLLENISMRRQKINF